MALDKDFQASADDRIGRILDRLSKVPAGETIAALLKMHNVRFELQDNPANWAASTLTITAVDKGVYHYKEPIIILKKDLSDDNLLQAIIHETGHLNQHFAGAGNPDRILTPEQYILFYRAAEADAQARATEVAWQMKQAGDAGPWEATRFVGYGDICDAYEKAVTADPASAEDGRAKRTAFDAWFGQAGRLAGYNESTVDWMIPSLERGRNDIFKAHGMTEKPLDDSWLKKLENGAGKPYMHLEGFRSVLDDPYYSRDTHTRPSKTAPANSNTRPAADTPREQGIIP